MDLQVIHGEGDHHHDSQNTPYASNIRHGRVHKVAHHPLSYPA